MKKGDKIICKCDYYNGYEFIKGQSYNVLNIYDDCVTIEIKDGLQRFYFRGHESNRNLPNNYNWFDDYFINIKQIRKLKLEELSDIRFGEFLKNLKVRN